MELPQSLNLYITFIEKEGPFLKVWGQTEKNNAIYVEQFLSGISLQFNAGLSKVSPESLQCGTLVCAKYEDNKYYRARITNIFLRESIVEVTFIDFGNKHIISCENIRSLQECPSAFISIPPLAIGFIFAEAHCVGGGEWNETIFESIFKEFRFREVQCHLLSQATQYYLVKLYLDSTDLCNLLIQRGLMQPISLQAQQAVLLSMSIQRQQIAQAATPTQAAAAINTYKAVTLEPGCLYPVYVSYINDGPCHFSVQLKQSEEILAKLMKDINCVTLRLLEDVPIPGTLCLARCQEDGNVCRAVVTNEVDNQFKVYYVDFGNYEIVSLDSLFQIPFKYVIPKVMAIRYSLAGVEKSTVTIEMQVAFKKFVDNRMLHMKVLPTLTRVAVPKCELWDPENKTSALEVVNRAAQHAYPEPIPLNRGFSQPVKVSFVFSCNRFYVQLVSKEKELSNLMLELQEICQTSSPIEVSAIKTGLPCCALFLADSLWYRSQVVEVLGETVRVRYIDFGNEEEVHINLLKTIDGEQLTVLRPQAIECCLNGYQNMGDDPERDGFLEEIILEDTFTMKVVEMFGKKVLVELFDLSNYNVASLLLDKIAAAKSQVSPMLVQAGNKIEHRKSLSQQREGQTPYKEGYSHHRDGQRDDYRGDRDIKTGRDDSNWNSKPNDRSEKSWRQDTRENRNFDKNSNNYDNDERNSWRENNKGFSPNNQRQNRQRSQEGDSWNTSNNDTNSNSGWNAPENTGNTNTDTLTNDGWNSSNNDQNRRQDDYKKNRRGFDNDRGSKYDNDRSDRYAGKKWEDGYGKKPDFRKGDGQLSPNGSEQGYHKGPRTSSRNDRGGRGGKFERNYDKPRGASFNSNSIGEDSWNVSAVVPPIDAAPASASFGSLEVVGIEAKVTISWFHHPCHFFCQITDSQDEFKTMMEEIQEFYKNRKPEQSFVGAPVIGLFPEDNVLYRAKVLEIVGSSYKVYYVDFGNVSTIQKIWPIDKKFMNLPAQAIVCSLNGIAPLADNWSDPDSFSKYFEKENFTCSFINKDEEKTYVNILYDSEDIAQLLIQDGLAVSTLSIIPEIEIPLLLNQMFRAVLKSVNNLGDIIIALECGLAVSCTMHNLETATETFEDHLRGLLEQTVIVYVDNIIDDRLVITLYDAEGYKIIVLNPDDGALESVELPCPMLVLHSTISGYVPYADQNSVFIQPLEYSEVVEYLLDQLFATYNDLPQECPICPEEGLLYAVHSEDGNWYRGRVLSFDDEKATVCFVDYGNSEEVAFSALRELATTFLEISFLCLQVAVSSDATAFIDKEVAGTIIYGEEGWEGSIEIIESSATESTRIEDFSDAGYTSSSLGKPDDVRDITESSTYVADEVVAEVAHGILDVDNLGIQDETAAPNIDDKAEFENAVPSIEEGEIQQYLEVRDEAEVEKVVDTFEDGEMQQIDENLVSTVEDGEMQQHLEKDAEIENAAPTIDDGDMKQHLDEGAFEDGEVQQHLDKDTEVENAVQTIEDGEMQQHLDESVAIGTPVYTSHVDSPNEFYLQFHDAISEIEELQDGIQTGAPEWSVIENPAAGIICAAPYSGDQKWYRAVILDADDDITTVRFMDFGNTDVIDNKTTQIKMLPPNLLSLAVYATRCSLKLEPLDEEWSASAITLFEELAMSDNVTAEFLDQNEKTNHVELYSDGLNIREELIQRKLAVTSTQTEETKSTGFVSHLNSPSEFWIQLENCVDELEWIAEQLSSAESFDELEDLAPGTLCAALFPDDTMWYRARILSNTVAGIELLFIDYGNSCTSSSLRQLPEDLVVTAPLAQKCSLQKPEGIPSWSPEAAAKFREISAEGQTIFTVKKISTGETSIVQLFIGDEDVSTMLLPDTEEGYVKAVDSLERLQIEKGDGELLEGSFQLEVMSGQELNEEAEQNFEQINKQGSTLFQIEFINNNTVRLYLNGHDIRPQLGGIKNASFDSSETEYLHSNEEVNMSEEQTETKSGLIRDKVDVLDKLDFNIQHNAEKDIHKLNDVNHLIENRLFDEPNSGSLLPCLATSPSELVDEPVIVDQIEAPSEECHPLEDSVHLPLKVNAEPADITSTGETESHNSIQDNSQTLSVGQCEASTTQNHDRIERSTQTDTVECEAVKISEIPEESEKVESPKECSTVANLNQERSVETLQDSSLTMNPDECEPLTSTEGLELSESPKKSSIEGISISSVYSPVERSSQDFDNDDVQESFQISNNIEYEPEIIDASLDESVPEVPTEKSSPVEDFVVSSPVEKSVISSNQEHQNDKTVQDSSQTTNTTEYKPLTSTAVPKESDIRESPKKTTPVKDIIISCVESPDDTEQNSVQTLNIIEYEQHSSVATTERPMVKFFYHHQNKSSPAEGNDAFAVESPVSSSNYEIQNDDTVQNSSQTLNSDEESGVEESQTKFPVEESVSSPVEPPVESSYQEHQNDDTEQETLDVIENEPHSPTASPEEPAENPPEEPAVKFSPVEGNTTSEVESQVTRSNYEIQNDDTLQDSSKTLNSDEESGVEESQTKFPVEDTSVSYPIESPVESLYQEHQNDDTEQETLDLIENEPHSLIASPEEPAVKFSPVEGNTTYEVESQVTSSNYEIRNDDTVQDSSQQVNSDEESGVEESQTKFPVEDTSVSSPIESPVESSYQDSQNDDTQQDSFQTSDVIEYEPHYCSVSPEKPAAEGNIDFAVESPVASSNYEIQNDNTVQDSSQTVSTGKCELHSTEESVVEESPKESSIEDVTASDVESPAASSNQDLQITNSQILNTDQYDSTTSTASPEKSAIQKSPKKSPSDTDVASPTIVSPEVNSSSWEVPSCSKTRDAEKPSPGNVMGETEVKVCVEQQPLNEDIGDHIVLENDNAVPNNVLISSDSGNESCPTTPQKNVGVAAPTNSPVGAQVMDVEKLPARCLFDNIKIESSRQDNDEMRGHIEGETVISQEKSLEEGELPNEIVKKMHFAGPSALEIDVSFEESTTNTLNDEIDASYNDLAGPLKSTEFESISISPENAQNCITEMDITIPLNPILGSLIQVNDTVQTLIDNPSEDCSESQDFSAETNLSKLTNNEQTSQEPSDEQLSKKNEGKDITSTAPVDECIIIKQSEIQTNKITPTLEFGECEISSSKKTKKSSVKPVVAKETTNKSSAEKVVPVPLVKSSIRISLSVAKVLASKKDEISSPATIPKKSKPSSKVTTVSKTLSKQTSVKVEAKSTQKKLPVKTVTLQPINKSLSVKDDAPKTSAPGKAKTGLAKKNSSSNGAKGLGTTKKRLIDKEGDLNVAMVSKKSGSVENIEVERSVIDSEIEKSKIESNNSTDFVHNAEEENRSVAHILESDKIFQDEDHKTERSEVESSSSSSDLTEMKSVEDIELEKKLGLTQ